MRKLLALVLSLLPEKLTQQWIISRYIEAGSIVGDMDSYRYIGEPIGYSWYLNRWIFWEKQIVRLGYQPISLDKFIEIGGYGVAPPKLAKLFPNQKKIFHAQIRKQQIEGALPKSESAYVESSGGLVMTGSYTNPSTEAKGDVIEIS